MEPAVKEWIIIMRGGGPAIEGAELV